MKKLLAAFTIVGIVAMSALAANLLNIGDATGATPSNTALRVAAVATAPKVTLTAPVSNAVVSSNVTVRAKASDANKVKNVQFQLDGVNLGAADTTAPYSVTWNTHLVSNGSHALTAIATNSSNLSTTSSTVNVTVNNTDNVVPTVSITTPASGATVSGVTTIAVSANDNVAVTRVVLSENGNVIRNATAQNAYGWGSRWNTANVADGSYTLTAVAYDAAGNTSSTSNTVTVSNNPTAPVAPNVSITAPAASATVTGNSTVSATAGGTSAITGVQFKLDGVNLGTAVTTAPYSVDWDTTTASNGTHVLTAVATNSALLSTTSSSVSVTVNNQSAPTAPTVAITAPAASATLSGATNSVTANAGGTSAITGVQFKLDGVNLGTAVTTAPYSVDWDTTTASNGSHVLTAVATNSASLTTTSASVTVTVNNPTAPTVAITAPAASATLSGATNSVTANAGGTSAITGVQFKLDGVNLGTAVTTAPYSVDWDTTTASNGSHVLTAVATNSASLTTTSASVTVTVNNPVVTPPASPNLIPNPSVETAQDANTPASWLASNWGTNTAAFSYLNTGHTGSRSVETQISQYTNGAANWYYADVPVTPGQTYEYTDWYQSNVDSEVDAEVTMNDGTVQYFYLGTVLANTNWTKFTATFTVPTGAKSMAAYQILAKVGYIISDDYSLNLYTPVPFNRGIVSVSFDDGWTNQYVNALPIMQQNGLIGTYNIISGSLTDQPDYMSVAQIKNLLAGGNEIASHTITHPDLTTMTAAQVTQEMSQSQITLQNALGVPVTDFAYPYGAYNTSTLAIGSQYYQSQRTVNAGYNTKDNLDLTQLKIYEVDSNISQAQVQGWINGAVADHAWLILVYHEIAVTPTDPTDALYDTQPTDLAAEMAYLKNSGAAVETVHQAINEVLPQL